MKFNDKSAAEFQKAYKDLGDARRSNKQDNVDNAVEAVGKAIKKLDPNNSAHVNLMEEVKKFEESRSSNSEFTRGKESISAKAVIEKINEQNTPKIKEEFKQAAEQAKTEAANKAREEQERAAREKEKSKRDAEIDKMSSTITKTLESGLAKMQVNEQKAAEQRERQAAKFEAKVAKQSAEKLKMEQKSAERLHKVMEDQKKTQGAEQEKAAKAAAKEREALAKAERKDFKGTGKEIDRELGTTKKSFADRIRDAMGRNKTKVESKEITEGNPLYDRNRGVGKENSIGQDMSDAHGQISRKNQVEARREVHRGRRFKDAHDVDYTSANPDGKWSIKATASEPKEKTSFVDKFKAAKAKLTGKQTGGRGGEQSR